MQKKKKMIVSFIQDFCDKSSTDGSFSSPINRRLDLAAVLSSV